MLSFASMAPRQDAVKHEFVNKIAWGCSSYDVIAPWTDLTWPDLTWSFFIYQKLHNICPIRYSKTRRRYTLTFFAICEKPQGQEGCTPSGRGLTRAKRGVFEHPLRLSFFRYSWNLILHSCSDNCSATFLKILGPGHQRSGHQISSSDPTSKKLYNRATATVVDGKIWNFQDLVYYPVPTTCISRIFFFQWPKVRSISWPTHYKSRGKNSNASNTDQTCSNRSEPCSVRLLLMTSVQLCIFGPRKSHLRSNNDVMRSMYVFAYNFWLEWYRDVG